MESETQRIEWTFTSAQAKICDMGKVCQVYTEGNQKMCLDDSARLWRYIPLERLFLYIEGDIFVPSVAKLRENDPFECRFPWGIKEFNLSMKHQFGDDYEHIRNWFFQTRFTESEKKSVQSNQGKIDPGDFIASRYRDHYLSFVRSTRFAWCWFTGGIESSAMWNHYGLNGVAIQTSVEKLKLALKQCDRDFVYGKMDYVIFPEGPGFFTEQSGLIQHPYFLKRREYKCENEVRFVTTGPALPNRKGISLHFQSTEWIEKILFSPTLNPSEVKSLKGAMKKLVPSVTCDQSKLLNEPSDEISILNIISDDESQGADSAWKSNTDDIPQLLKMATIKMSD